MSHHPITLVAALLCVVVTGACSQPSDTVVSPELASCEGGSFSGPPLKLATYNIKSGLYSSLDEVGDVLEELDADVVALQEVDRLTDRTDGEDQPKELGERLGMEHAFVAARTETGGDYGVALLSRLPFKEVRRIPLKSGGMTLEPRVALDATLCLGDRPMRAVSVHADVYPWSAADHARSLADKLDETAEEDESLRLVGGDLNATPDADGPSALVGVGLVDLIARLGRELTTFPGMDSRIDYLLADEELARGLRDVTVLDRDASDHFPLVTEIELNGE